MRCLYMIPVCLVALAGCDGTPLRSTLALARVDPMSTDAKALRVAVAVPPTFRMRKDVIEMQGSLTYSDGSDPVSYTFNLAPTGEAGAGLEDAPGTVTVLALAPDGSAERFEAYRAEVARAEEAGVKGVGSFGVSADLCRTTPELPDSAIVVFYIRPAELTRFVPLSRPTDAVAEARKSSVTEDEWDKAIPPCA